VVFKGKSIPRVAALVECMFMAELKNQLLTAMHDMDSLELPVGLDVAQGSEGYTLYNGQEQVLKSGDMYIADRQGVISSVIYGPDQRSRIRPETRQALFTVYVPPGIGEAAVWEHLGDIQANVQLISPEAKTDAIQVYPANPVTD
jgi:DNA/RNA-binding domain of Phe-tRNA-synthetase-like protein